MKQEKEATKMTRDRCELPFSMALETVARPVLPVDPKITIFLIEDIFFSIKKKFQFCKIRM